MRISLGAQCCVVISFPNCCGLHDKLHLHNHFLYYHLSIYEASLCSCRKQMAIPNEWFPLRKTSGGSSYFQTSATNLFLVLCCHRSKIFKIINYTESETTSMVGRHSLHWVNEPELIGSLLCWVFRFSRDMHCQGSLMPEEYSIVP